MPLIRRLPKRGFNNAAFHKNYAIVNLSSLAEFRSGSVVNEVSLREAKLVRGNFHGIKILGGGELKHGLTIQVHKVSAAARDKIEKAGGTISAPEAKAALPETDRAQKVEAKAQGSKRSTGRKKSVPNTKKKTANK
jgi:ribosomal protein L18E